MDAGGRGGWCASSSYSGGGWADERNANQPSSGSRAKESSDAGTGEGWGADNTDAWLHPAGSAQHNGSWLEAAGDSVPCPPPSGKRERHSAHEYVVAVEAWIESEGSAGCSVI
jgi:hypothetical protein